jgi:hypothetical protein
MKFLSCAALLIIMATGIDASPAPPPAHQAVAASKVTSSATKASPSEFKNYASTSTSKK